jgi:exodeoxyribonuclease VII large subunit
LRFFFLLTFHFKNKLTEIPHIKLSELAEMIRGIIRTGFENRVYWVVAEVSGHKFYPGQDRHYLDLVEKMEGKSVEAAKLKCTVWSEASKKIIDFQKVTGQNFADGLQVLVKVKVEYHIVYGLSLVVSDIDHSFTLGNIEKQRLETLMRLVKENPGKIYQEGEEYITANKKLPLKSVLQNIALVASPNSEGFHDFISNITKNKFGYTFHIDHYFSSVQGMAAEKELVDTLVKIYESKKEYDCVVIIRGGGAKTDFLVFDTYGVARAVARFPIPVITGIGHHRDVSVADMMAHTATNAPTKAAELIISHNRAFEEKISVFQKSIVIKTQQLIASSLNKINSTQHAVLNNSRMVLTRNKDGITRANQTVINKSKTILFNLHKNLLSASGHVTTSPFIKVRNKQNDLLNISNNLKSFATGYFLHQHSHIQHHISVFKLMSPKNILKKGFAIVKQKGKILKDAEGIEAGNELIITLYETEITTKVISKNTTHGTENEL